MATCSDMTEHALWGVKNPPAMQETPERWVRSLDQEDTLEDEVATGSSILTWGCP